MRLGISSPCGPRMTGWLSWNPPRIQMISARARPDVATKAWFRNDGCGGEFNVRRYTVNLDQDRPVALPDPGVPTSFTVSQKDPEVFEITASTSKCDCMWELLVPWTAEGEKGVVIIDDNGTPFHTVPSRGYPQKSWTLSNGDDAWLPDSQPG